MSASTSTRVTLVVPVKAGKIFDLLANPYRHSEIDASGMVGSDDNASPITGAGQVFTMNMRHDPGADDPGRYQTDNHVDVFEHNRAIGWRVAPVGGDLLGWAWRYHLTPDGDKRTQVALTYDWTDTSAENAAKYGVPRFNAADLEASLSLLAKAVLKG